MTIDPRQFADVASREAARAGRRDRCGSEEYLGQCYLWLCEAAERFDPAAGVPFGAYATKYIRWRLVDERYSRHMGRDTSKGGSRDRGRFAVRQIGDGMRGLGRAAGAPSPVEAAIGREEAALAHERVTASQVDPDFAYTLARGLGATGTMAAAEGCSEDTIFTWLRHMRYEHGAEVGASYKPRQRRTHKASRRARREAA